MLPFSTGIFVEFIFRLACSTLSLILLVLLPVVVNVAVSFRLEALLFVGFVLESGCIAILFGLLLLLEIDSEFLASVGLRFLFVDALEFSDDLALDAVLFVVVLLLLLLLADLVTDARLEDESGLGMIG